MQYFICWLKGHKWRIADFINGQNNPWKVVKCEKCNEIRIDL